MRFYSAEKKETGNLEYIDENVAQVVLLLIKTFFHSLSGLGFKARFVTQNNSKIDKTFLLMVGKKKIR